MSRVILSFYNMHCYHTASSRKVTLPFSVMLALALITLFWKAR
jgi:hypothetical protein